ncbi:MAG: BBE domain-containing protein, partial [Chloroflexi bacterium]|nr:BBE domain-containing protein [Chloroflexota bacterium]
REEAPTCRLLTDFCNLTGGSPVLDILDGLPYSQLKRSFEDLDGREGAVSGVRIRSEFFANPMRPRTINELLPALIDPMATRRRQITFTALGGAYNRLPETATAFVHRRELFMLEHCSSEPGDWVDRSWQIAHTDGSGGVYPNFPDPRLVDSATAYHGTNIPRLASVKKNYDPHRLFTFSQSI